MLPKYRRIVLFGLLAASTGLVALGDRAVAPGDTAVIAATARAARPAHPGNSAAPSGEEAMIQELRPRAPTPELTKAFVARDWTPPHPEPTTKAGTASSPTAPEMPSQVLTFLGKQLAEGHWLVFLGQDGKTYIVKEGDVIEGTYRVDAIRPPDMTLTYLPLLQQQTLTIGDIP